MGKPFFLVGWIKTAILLTLDALFWLQKRKVSLPENPKRILVCNTASFGDVVISTVVLPALKKRYPQSEIAFLTSIKTADVLKDHPLVARVHTVDYWFGNSEKRRWKACLRFVIDAGRAAKEMRSFLYDMAIDLYPHFFLSAIPILWRARIPVRIGRYTRGYSNLLTHAAPRTLLTEYMGQAHLNLLKILDIEIREESPFPSYDFSRKPHLLSLKEYIVVHMGTAHALKEWDPKKWAQVVKGLLDQGKTVVLTGKGEREQIRCDQVAARTGCMNLCNQLSWSAFSATVQHAKLLISVDSAAVHLASAVRAPCIVLFAGISSMSLWKPPYAKCKALMKKLSCAPCLVPKGCFSMSCIREIEASEVLCCAEKLLNLRNRSLSKPAFERDLMNNSLCKRFCGALPRTPPED